ncbi:hypothetical protein GCM10022254_32360 [Actinomadura meridiana]|uniref:PASTA domain-containing protein n=1 Tax=Actinomadura meridiana TaxID=559626 RepID=A0ABP8C2B6_9ACTN
MSIDEIMKHIDPVPSVPPRGAGARELLDEITAVPRDTAGRSHRRGVRFRQSAGPPRRWFAVAVAAGLAAVVIPVSWLLPGVFGAAPAAALDIRMEGGYYIVTVKDAFADPDRYEAQLRKAGLDVSLRVVPVSPSLEGTIFQPYDPRENGLSTAQLSRRKDVVQSIEKAGACASSYYCTIGVKIPVGYRAYKGPEHRGPAVISLGREARPAEHYTAFAGINNPGEPLQCLRIVDKTVDEVRSMMRARGVTAADFAVPLRGTRASVPGSWYVHEGWLSQPGKALLVAAETKIGPPYPPLAKGCPGAP